MSLPPWALDIRNSSPKDEVSRYGYPLSEFYSIEDVQKILPGVGRNRNIRYTPTRFRYENPAPLTSEILIRALNHAIMAVLAKSKINIAKGTAHLVLTHDGFRNQGQLHIHLNQRNDPGRTVYDLIERFSQSNNNLKLHEIDFEVVHR